MQALHQRVVVKKGGIIEIRFPDLREGAKAEVIVMVESPPPVKKVQLASLIGSGKGGFKNPKQVDEFLRREREAWES